MSTIRIRLSGETRKELEHLLGQAFRAGDLGSVRRVTALSNPLSSRFPQNKVKDRFGSRERLSLLE